MFNLIEFRGAIELWSIVHLSARVAQLQEEALETIRELYGYVDGLKEKHMVEDREAMAEFDYRFHSTIIESQENPIFGSIFATLRSFLYEEIFKSQETYRETEKIWKEHNAIVEGIESGDVQKATDVFVDHIENIKRRLEKKYAY